MTPTHAQVLGVQIRNEISRGGNRFRMKDIADAAKYIAAVIERNDLDFGSDRDPRFQIHYDHGVAADGHGERIHGHEVAIGLTKSPLRNDDLARPGFFVSKSA